MNCLVQHCNNSKIYTGLKTPGHLPSSGSTNSLSRSREEEIGALNLAISLSSTLDKTNINALEQAVCPGLAILPRVARNRSTLEGDLITGLGRLLVGRGDIAGESAGASDCLEAVAAVAIGSVAAELEFAGLLVVGKSLGCVVKGDAVGDDVVGSAGITAAELEAVTVSGEVGEVPAVDTVTPGDGVLDGNGRGELPVKSQYLERLEIPGQ